MLDVLTRVSQLQRPDLLVRTARHGLTDYDRPRHLRRLLRSEALPGPNEAVMRLMETEATLETMRREKRADYAVARHVEVLIAIMCEAETLKGLRRNRPRQVS